VSEETKRNLAEWDTEIEAEFQRAVRATKAKGKRKSEQRLIGCPLGFLADVCRLTEGRTTLVVALCIYRRVCIEKTQTITLPTDGLSDFGIDRRRKREALIRLQVAGLIKIGKAPIGRPVKVTLKWQPR
jgi:hypothetical protein